MPGRRPRGQRPVEHPHVLDTHVAQQPPRAARGKAVPVVIDDNGVTVIDPPAACCSLKIIDARQGMAAVARFAVARELGLKIDVHGTGNVPRLIERQPVWNAQTPAHIENANGLASTCCVVEQRGEFMNGDERVRHPKLRSWG